MIQLYSIGQNDRTLVFSTQHAPVGTGLCVVCVPDESCVSVVKFNGVIEADDSIICNKFNSFFMNSVLDINQLRR